MSQPTQELPPHATPFFQRPLVQQIVPLLTSFAFHVTIVVIAALLIVPLLTTPARKPIEQVIIPDTTLVQGANAGGVPNPGLSDDPARAARQSDETGHRDSSDWATKKSDTLVANLTQGAADTKQNVTPIGVGQQSTASVTGLTERGQSTGGGLAPFGPAGGGGGGQGKGLFGLPGGNVKKVAYVCDASGSMLGTLQTLLNLELRKAIDSLRLSQSFNVIFFQNDDPATIQRGQLLLATPKNKQLAYDFLGRYEMKGSTNPLPALREAFAMRPELIFLLTDGVFDEPEKVVAEIEKLNVGRKVKVNTILFFAADPENPAAKPIVEEAERTMKQIAEAHGGTYKLVRPADLQR